MSVVDDRPDLSRLVDRDAADKMERRASLTGCASRRASTSPALTLSRTSSAGLGCGAATPHGPTSAALATPSTAASASSAGTPRFQSGARSRMTPGGSGHTPRLPLVSPHLPASAPACAPEDAAENRNLRRTFDQFATFGRSQVPGEHGRRGPNCLSSSLTWPRVHKLGQLNAVCACLVPSPLPRPRTLASSWRRGPGLFPVRQALPGCQAAGQGSHRHTGGPHLHCGGGGQGAGGGHPAKQIRIGRWIGACVV